MQQVYEININIPKAFLVSVDTGEFDVELSINELAELCQTAHIEVVSSAVQKRESVNIATYVGEGKLEEIKEFCVANEIDLLICDAELTATQLRNIEKQTDLAVIDRTMLILDIFAQRAVSSEGKIQVELAQQKYRLPRLAGLGTALSRLGSGGGNSGPGVGTRGPGETKLETDKRHIRRKIHSLETKIKELSEKRELTRRRRIKSETPSVSIVGYTNAGKSTLLNKLTDAGVLSENMLFATLDPTARALELPSGQNSIFIDTVGFISRLPHHLVQAFKSTLEEAVYADVVLLLCDISDENFEMKLEVSKKLLGELGCSEDKIITVFNKADLADKELIPNKQDDDIVVISAKTGEGIDEMLEKVDKKLDTGFKRMTIIVPYSNAGFISKIRENGKVFSEEYKDDGIFVDAIIEKRLLSQAEEMKAEQ